MDHRPQAWGRPRDDVYGAYDASYLHTAGAKQATQAPVVTGTSVVGLKFKDGVVIAADNLASYGSLARFTSTHRLRSFANSSVVGFGGDVSDMQYLDRHLTELAIDEAYANPPDSSLPEAAGEGEGDDEGRTATAAEERKNGLNAANLHKYLSKLLYGRRNKFDPLWNQILVAGLDADDAPFLASADLRGTVFSAPALASGYGSMLAIPIMRKVAATEEDAASLTRDEAVAVVRECMKVLFYRDARSHDSYSLAVVTKAGVELSTEERLQDQSWAFADRIKGYGTQTV
ncbi:hypothetical protein RB594_001230 [Gaeumannomyces avenae]